MPTYILLLRNDSNGAARMLASGQFGAAEQAKAVEALNGRVLGQWAVTGRFDAVLAAELPDDADALAVAFGATQAGQYAELLTAFEPETFERAKDSYDRAEIELTRSPERSEESDDI
jgi:uncharacterized protein with GYD domain